MFEGPTIQIVCAAAMVIAVGLVWLGRSCAGDHRWLIYWWAFIVGFFGVHQYSVNSYFEPPGSGGETVGVLWFSSGLLIGVLLVTPWRWWPMFLLAATAVMTHSDLVINREELFANTTHNPWLTSGVWTFASLCEGVLGAAPLRLVKRRVPDLIRPRALILFLVISVFSATAISALIGVATYAYLFEDTRLIEAWQVWWFSDALGTLALAPVIVAWYRIDDEPRWALTWQRRTESGMLLVLFLVVVPFALGPVNLSSKVVIDYPYLVILLLVWAALRYNAVVSGFAALACAAVAVFTANGMVAALLGMPDSARGPFFDPGYSPAETVLPLQAFLLVMLGLTPVILALYRQRQRVEQQAVDYRDQLYEAQRMEAVAQLAGGVAHDLNNLLAVIGAYRQQVDERIGEDPKLAPALRAMDQATGQAATLSRSLLDLSRREPAQAGRVELDALVRRAIDVYLPLLPASIKLRLRGVAEARFVVGRSEELQQVVLNLLVNARDAMRTRGGVLDVELHSNAESPGSVCLTVRDTGCGIDPEVLPQIFEPLFTTKPQGQGTGLGLAIIRSIVQEHGGRIEVTSTPGRGSAFTVTLPLADIGPVAPGSDTLFRQPVADEAARPPATDERASPGSAVGPIEAVLLIQNPQVRGALLADLVLRGIHAWAVEDLDHLLQVGPQPGSKRFAVLDGAMLNGTPADTTLSMPLPTVLLVRDGQPQPAIVGDLQTLKMPFRVVELAQTLQSMG